MLDYKTIIRLKKLGLNNLAIADGAKLLHSGTTSVV